MILCLPFLMFQGRAQEAINHYLETFPDAELLEIMHHPEGTEIYDHTTPGTSPDATQHDDAGTERSLNDTAAMEEVVDLDNTLVATAQLRIGGQILMIQDSLVKHDFDFTPSISVAVVVDTEEEFRQITDKLAEGGSFLMEPDHYDFAQNFTWVQDRFGISWQINQPLSAPGENPVSDTARDVAQAQAPDWT